MTETNEEQAKETRGRKKKAEPIKKADVNDSITFYKFKLVDNGHNKAKVAMKEDFNDNRKLKPLFDDEGRKTIFLEKFKKECPVSRPSAEILNSQAENTMIIYLESKDQKQVGKMFNVESEIN